MVFMFERNFLHSVYLRSAKCDGCDGAQIGDITGDTQVIPNIRIVTFESWMLHFLWVDSKTTQSTYLKHLHQGGKLKSRLHSLVNTQKNQIS